MKTCIRYSLALIIGALILNLLWIAATQLELKLAQDPKHVLGAAAVSVLVFAVIYFTVARVLTKLFFAWIGVTSRIDAVDLALSFLGGLAGTLVLLPVTGMVGSFGLVGCLLTLAAYPVLFYAGARILASKRGDVLALFNRTEPSAAGRPKVLDTSVIIDGRILDVLKTGFIEGTVIIPDFVLDELRHIADSPDTMKRARGRLGLDVLNKIKDLGTPVEIMTTCGDTNTDVDGRLLKLSEEHGAFIVTNDYNLNKIAEFRQVPVLNINDLSNAVKSIVLPGQDMNVNVVKDGKEVGQGVAYLNDGTMIVVEGGKRFIGDNVYVTVTSVLQTSAGRMIFAKPSGSMA